MTGPEIQRLKDKLYFKYYGDECRTPDHLKQPWTRHDERLMNELDARNMINSILIYGGSCEKDGYNWNRYLTDYMNSHYGVRMTEKKMLRLIKEQEDTLRNATIESNVYEDGEGVTYNSVDW